MQDIFDAIDDFSRNVSPTPPGPEGPPGGPPGANPDTKPPGGGIEIPIDPETEALLKEIANEVSTQAAILAFIAVDGYAKALASTDIPFALGQEYLGGAWTFAINLSANTMTLGLAELINFDSNVARTNLENELASIDAGNTPKSVDLSGGATIKVNPDTGKVRLRFNNDSLLLTRAATVTEISTEYSREVYSSQSGKLYAGAKAKFYRVSLSRVSVRFGEISDSSELWQSIKDANYNYSKPSGCRSRDALGCGSISARSDPDQH